MRDKFGTILKLGYVLVGLVSAITVIADNGIVTADWIAILANVLFFGLIAKDVWDMRDAPKLD